MTLARFWWILGLALVTLAVIVCLVPSPTLPTAFTWNDKLSHVAGHTAMAAYFAGLVPPRRWWKVFLSLLVLGIGIEIAQAWLHTGRAAEAVDVLANEIGAVLGLGVAWLGLARWPEWAAWLLGRRTA